MLPKHFPKWRIVRLELGYLLLETCTTGNLNRITRSTSQEKSWSALVLNKK